MLLRGQFGPVDDTHRVCDRFNVFVRVVLVCKFLTSECSFVAAQRGYCWQGCNTNYIRITIVSIAIPYFCGISFVNCDDSVTLSFRTSAALKTSAPTVYFPLNRYSYSARESLGSADFHRLAEFCFYCYCDLNSRQNKW